MAGGMSVADRKKLLKHGLQAQAARLARETPRFASAVMNNRAQTYSRDRVRAMQAVLASMATVTVEEMFGVEE